jgi:7,8-dihydropterin-6-yl-methyl-4-(beta-D-ribofuranosyl)aminobenzene 5'-phosphate synthase
MITFTIIYDNNAHDPALTPQWGFACLIERADLTLLFDTGGNGSTLMANMAALDKDPADVDLIMLSHEHGDHTGGLARFLETSAQADAQPADPPRPREGHIPEVVVPTVFASSFKAQIRERTSLVEVSEPLNVRPGLWSTGEVKGPVAEQAAVVQTRKGWVVVTGCAHPGVEAITARALEVTGGPIALVVGGYHLHNAGTSRIAETIEALRGMDVAAVAPTHCTGDKARAMFAEAYGDAYYEAGAGFTLQLETQP